MKMSKRMCLFALCGAVLILVSWNFALLTFIIVNLILLGLWAYDYIATPSPKLLSAVREMDTKLSLGTFNNVRIVVRNGSKYALKIWVTDDVPQFFRSSLPMEDGGIVPAHGAAVFGYDITPLKRGLFHFEAMHLKYYGLLGLCVKKLEIDTDTFYKVYPNMKALSQYQLNTLEKNILLMGLKKTRTVSSGGEFSSLREYADGDDFRKINWAATARKGGLIVNTYVPERNQHIAIFLDSSRIMNSEINEIKKLDYAINASFLLTDYVIKGGDNLSLMVFDKAVQRYLPPGKGPAQFNLVAENLYDIESEEVSASYLEAFQYFASKQQRRSLIFIFTELFNSDEALRFTESVKRLLSKHIVFTVTIFDPRIYEMAEKKPGDTDEIFVKSAAVKVCEDRKNIRMILNQAGILNTDVAPDKLSLEVVSKYVDIKKSGIL